MDEAQSLFREGVLALRERRDAAAARSLLMQSLKLNPHNEMAWLWLSRTTNDPDKRLQCVERALAINPANEQALALRAALLEQSASPAAAPSAPPPASADTDAPSPPRRRAPTKAEQGKIEALLEQAQELLDEGDVEGAIANWVHVLHVQPDHEAAMRSAVGYLSRLKYLDDARELVWRALDAGTTHPSIYLTAIDIARVQGSSGEVAHLAERLLALPNADDQAAAAVVEYFMREEQITRALELSEKALRRWPRSQRLLLLAGDLHKGLDEHVEAARFYDEAARIGAGTQVGRAADRKLRDSAPVLTDRERGSLALTLREAAAFGLVFLLLAWQDAGLNLLNVGRTRWVGVALALLGGYLLVSATSSPQQRPLARWLGGSVPPPQPDAAPKAADDAGDIGLVKAPTNLPIIPTGWRAGMGLVGLVVLVIAFYLVFNTSLRLLLNPAAPTDLPNIADLLY